MPELLIIDDEKYVCEGLKGIINWEMLGFDSVYTAFDGEGAMEIIKSRHPDLVISDIRMPMMDGIQLARFINRFYPRTRLIFVSAYNDFHYARQAIEYGVRSYLLKPVDREELREAVIRVMGRSEYPRDYSCDPEDAGTVLIRKVQQYIHDNYDHKLTLEEVAARMYISPQYLCKKFKKHTGKQFVDYIIEVKIKKARSLLKDSDIKVKDIAVKLGFNDYTYFCKVFKKYESMTPLQYRAKFII